MSQQDNNTETLFPIPFVLPFSLPPPPTHLRLHQADLLDFSLQDQKPVVVQVDAFLFEGGHHVSFGRLLVVEEVAADTVLFHYGKT